MAKQKTKGSPDPEILIQTRVPKSVHQKLVERIKVSGDVSVGPYLRRLIYAHLESGEHV